MKKIDPTVDEAIQTLNMKDGPSRSPAAQQRRSGQCLGGRGRAPRRLLVQHPQQRGNQERRG